jgi:battenin
MKNNTGILGLSSFFKVFNHIYSLYCLNRWYNVVYQAAVFVSRSSLKFFEIKFLPIFPILQFVNVFLLLSHLLFDYIPSIWIVFVIVFWEGLLGGGCYVNGFNMVTVEISKDVRETSMAITSIADGAGITLAALTSIPTHNAICKWGG